MMNQLRFLFITGNYKPAVKGGGPVETVSALAESLVKDGHEVSVVCLNLDDDMPLDVPLESSVSVEGVNVYYFPSRKTVFSMFPLLGLQVNSFRRWSKSFNQWFREKLDGFDVIHLHLGFLSVAPFVSSLVGARSDKILLYHQRGNLDPRRFARNKWLKALYASWFERPVLARCDTLFALSTREAEVYRYLSPSSEIVLLPNGVDLHRWRAAAKSSIFESEFASRKTGSLRLVWFARWDLRKGPDVFVGMVHRLQEMGCDVQAMMVGPGECIIHEQVCRMINDLGLQDCIHVAVNLDSNEKVALLQGADFYVLPTQGEGFSVGVLEAMAAGCCVLTTKEANFPELETCHAGVVVERDPYLMADACIQNASDDAIALLRENANKLIRERYTWATIKDEYVNVVRGLRNRRNLGDV